MPDFRTKVVMITGYPMGDDQLWNSAADAINSAADATRPMVSALWSLKF